MIQNKDLYEFETPEKQTEFEPEDALVDSSTFRFPSKLIYQTITSLCCLILLLIVIQSHFSWLEWVKVRIHYAVNTSMEDSFGKLSESSFFKTILSNAGNLVKLEDITKTLSEQDWTLKDQKTFQNSIWPVQGSITKGYGWRYNAVEKMREFNSGIEISAAPDSPVLAIADGTIQEIEHQPQQGWEIVINHGNGWSSIYHYLGQVNVRIGQNVKAGDMIAQISRPSQEKGAIILIEIKNKDQTVDPLSVLVS